MHTVIVVPTYNERENLPLLLARVLAETSCSILVVDDESPDGTGALADAWASAYPSRVSVLHRLPPRGLGRAYLDGLGRALDLGADLVCQMDADLSHDPRHVPALQAAARHADVAVGSRYIPSAGVENWPLHRRLLSLGANRYVGLLLGLGVRDATSGFKCWRRDALAAVLARPLRSDGYSLQFEMLFRAIRARLRVVEVPIVFVERREGASKMSTRVLRESMWMPLRLLTEAWLTGRDAREHDRQAPADAAREPDATNAAR